MTTRLVVNLPNGSSVRFVRSDEGEDRLSDVLGQTRPGAHHARHRLQLCFVKRGDGDGDGPRRIWLTDGDGLDGVAALLEPAPGQVEARAASASLDAAHLDARDAEARGELFLG